MTVTTSNILDVRNTKQCGDLFSQEMAIIFKHSHACGRSQIVYREVVEFCNARPDVNVYLISVLDSRAAANFVEEHTGVEHESPQILALRNGKVFAHASHWDITFEFLACLVK
jgi:bacillithiol system protein YtxJ